MRRLLVALEENAGLLPELSVERATLERELGAAEEAKSQQDAFTASRQLATQKMRAALGRAKDAVLQLQNAAKFKLGPRNEKLVVFQVTPLRRRGSRSAARLKRQEEELQKQQASLAKKEEELLQRRDEAAALQMEVERLKKEMGAAAAL
jgi:N-acetyl-beta-hexosaminidase